MAECWRHHLFIHYFIGTFRLRNTTVSVRIHSPTSCPDIIELQIKSPLGSQGAKSQASQGVCHFIPLHNTSIDSG